MMLKPSKIETVLFGTHTQRATVTTAAGTDVAGVAVHSVKPLSANLEAILSMDRHVTNVICSCSYHTQALRHTILSLNFDTTSMIAHVVSAGNFDRLQVAYYALA
jgi:hypothetical protein